MTKTKQITDAATTVGLTAIEGRLGAVWIYCGDADEQRETADRVAAESGYERHRGPDGDYYMPATPEVSESDVPTLAEALTWASTATAGDYLVYYEDTGLTHDKDPGSRCGYADSELDAISKALRKRDLRLDADDVGLIAAAME